MNNDQFLAKYALNDIWCAPRQDNQWVLEPKRITPLSGALGSVNLLGKIYKLPDNTRYYHVFHIGSLDPELLNLLRQRPVWDTDKFFKISDAMNQNGVEVTIYNDKGINVPRTDTYYIYTNDRCMFVVIPNLRKIPIDFERERIFFRFYSNPEIVQPNNASNNRFAVGTFNTSSNTDILNIETALQHFSTLPGKVRHYLNGYYTDKLVIGNVEIGDIVEFVYDSSIKKTIRLKMSDLWNFPSRRDGVYKFLLHYPGDNDFVVDYHDDLDVHIVLVREGQFERGVYYNRNQLKNHRMITHKDYAIDSNMAMILRDKLQESLGLAVIYVDETYIELTIREARTNRKIGFESHRIRELYKLPEDVVKQALIGLNAVVPEWYCANLEASQMVDMMNQPWTKFNNELIESGYGYNAISKIIGDNPIKTVATSNNPVAKLSPACEEKSTVYEYDDGGLLLGWYLHMGGQTYTCRNKTTALVESIVGHGGLTSNSVYGQNQIPIENKWEYRIYRCHIYDGIADNDWEDITDTSLYSIENGKVVWKGVESNQWLCVRVDDKFIAYDDEITHVNGILGFTINENPTGNPVDDLEVVPIPFAQLDIWMNEFKLIRDLDYFVEWPRVIISNKTYLLTGSLTKKQKIHVRACRLAGANLNLDPVDDYGWIYHGSLSNNNIYDLRDDRVMQINVGGRVKDRSVLTFAEDRPSASIVHTLNGFPYQIKDTVVPFDRFTESSAYALREKSQETDKRVSEFLTEHYGDMEPEGVSSIGTRWPVVSSFLSHIVHLLQSKQLNIPPDRLLRDVEIHDRCQPHEWLLRFDPLGKESLDNRYAFVIPHASSELLLMDYVDFRFFVKVVEFYGSEKVVYKEYLAIKP